MWQSIYDLFLSLFWSYMYGTFKINMLLFFGPLKVSLGNTCSSIISTINVFFTTLAVLRVLWSVLIFHLYCIKLQKRLLENPLWVFVWRPRINYYCYVSWWPKAWSIQHKNRCILQCSWIFENVFAKEDHFSQAVFSFKKRPIL